MERKFEPTEALAMARDARERVAARAASPGWYAPLYGLICGFIVASVGLPQPLGSGGVLIGVVFVGLLYRYWTEKTGLSVNGYRSGPTRTIAVAHALALVVLMLTGIALRSGWGLAWAPFACGAIAAVFSTFASIAWDRAWRADMKKDPQ